MLLSLNLLKKKELKDQKIIIKKKLKEKILEKTQKPKE